jgi:hypothetical protein
VSEVPPLVTGEAQLVEVQLFDAEAAAAVHRVTVVAGVFTVLHCVAT